MDEQLLDNRHKDTQCTDGEGTTDLIQPIFGAMGHFV
jgi:hypothetical protein